MKVCPACGEVYRADAARCAWHEVPLRSWTEATWEVQLGVTTDVDRHLRAIDTPPELRGIAGELTAAWRTPERDAPGATEPLVQVSASLARPRAPARGRVLGGRYQLTRQLGVGGYGAVFAAEDLATRARVAVKVLTPSAAGCAEMITRFHREAIAASRSRHPHIVEIVDFDVDDDGSHYIVMECLEGQDLAQVLDRTRCLRPARALVIAAQCARGLAAAHRVGVLHRDLKPANVFLVRRPGGGESVKIIDFGISKLTRAAGDYTDVTSASKVVGTPFYMSPEQARGADLDARTDIYALGVMLFEMLVGERPFTGRSPIEILTRHAEAPRIRPSTVRPELAACPGLDALVLRAIAAAPEHRHRSMEELGEAIVTCLRAIDPVAAEDACEITGELTDRDEVAPPALPRGVPGSRRRGARAIGLGLGFAAAVAVAVALATPRGRGDDARDAPEDVPPLPPAAAAPVTVPVPVPVAIPATSPSPDAAPSAPVIEVDAPRDDVDPAREPAPWRGTARPEPRPARAGAAALGVEEW